MVPPRSDDVRASPVPSPSPSAVDDAPMPVPPRRRRWRGTLVALVCVLLVGGLAWYLTHRPAVAPTGMAGGGGGPGGPGGAGPGGPGGPGGAGGRGGRGAGATTVGTATAHRADIPVLLEALGTVTPLANVTVQAQVSGVLTQVLFREGQMVRKGEALATIDPQPFQITLASAQGARQRDEAALQAARVTLQRYRTLLTQDSIARQEVDTQAATVLQLEGTVAIDRATENNARLNLGYTRIVAPIGGRVGLRTIDAGNFVSAGGATGVAVITQLAPIDVQFAIPQQRVPEVQARLREGARMPVAAWDQARTRRLDTGDFSTLDNAVDTATGTVRAKARFANTDGNLFPSQFVNARLLLRTVAAAVVVPVTALRHGPDGDFVYVLKADRTVALRTVQRGESTVDDVAIAAGLDDGEVVVTEGGDRLKDGTRVQTAADRAASGASGGGYGGGGYGSGRGGASGAASGGRGRRTEFGPAAGGAGSNGAAAPGADAGRTDAGGASRTDAGRPGDEADRGRSAARGAASTSPSAPAASGPPGGSAVATPNALPTPEERQRMLDSARDDPVQLERRQRFLAALDRGDPAAIERWQQMLARRGGGARPAP